MSEWRFILYCGITRRHTALTSQAGSRLSVRVTRIPISQHLTLYDTPTHTEIRVSHDGTLEAAHTDE
jgi:hypothetical protein